ncbi:MAG: glycosyltransferase() [uncultured Acidimicrobiales bacterium]|uniref:Glycosyltransferase( ) n=1 Tax=uncultured Acidimicrobiales bacterium TaxID=310071 RepID=A0A6J4IYA7_9ACTN|nr:MAG: glycosyltransferase() [uncultured Acidimicrobiales bacterium]
MAPGRLVMGLLFFPRGGSAQVTRYLAIALERAGWSVSLVAGSLGRPGDGTYAPTFFRGITLRHLDYTPAVEAARVGGEPFATPVPMHPSYEDRTGAPDGLLASVDPVRADHLAEVWEAPLAEAGAGSADILHLHHLTPQHDAVTRRWPSRPVVAHLHGTEIKFIEEVERRRAVVAALGQDLAGMPEAVQRGSLDVTGLDASQVEILRTTRWSQWRHGEHWLGHLRRLAAQADHVVTVSPADRVTAVPLLRLPDEQVTAVPNGVDTERFRPRRLSPEERRACLRRWLVEDPRGWDERGGPGSVSYGEADLDHLLGPAGDGTVLVYVGRFTAAKRVPLLVRAFSRARTRTSRSLALLVWGGHPGEWEGQHPVTVAGEVGSEGVFFAGWRGHTDLPDGLAASDVLVMPSVNDSFAQTALEAMATGRPVLATRSGGFPAMINLDPSRPTGWLVEPDDVEDLATALVEVAEQPDEVARRGANALAHARAELSWDGRVAAFERVYASAVEHRARR